jgi:hypothetical protein
MRQAGRGKSRVHQAVTSAIVFAIIGTAGFATCAFALSESPVGAASPEVAPPPPPPESMKVVPAVPGHDSGASEAGAASIAPKKTSTTHSTTHHAGNVREGEVEPASARLRLREDAWIFSGPSKWTKHITRAHQGKFVIVTGSTRAYLQVRLKDGQVGYVEPSAVDIVKPSDTIFHLTHDAAVLDAPNKWAKKVAEVHQGHDVHVTGIALNYMQIRMKSGLVGFIPAAALQ